MKALNGWFSETPTDGWLPPGNYAVCHAWALENRGALEAYATQVQQEGTAADQLRQFLAEGHDPEGIDP